MKKTKAKEPVKIRFKKLANGNQSIYLDIYTNGKRAYEFLKLYIIPGNDAATKAQNDNAMTAANAIKAQRIMDLANGKAGIKQAASSKMMLFEWLEAVRDEKMRNGQSDRRAIGFNSLIAHLTKFMNGKDISLSKIDVEFCRSFISYLSTAKTLGATKGNKTISVGSIRTYFMVFKTALNEAERKGIINNNPTRKLSRQDTKPISGKADERVYLSSNELRSMIQADCKNQNVKKAFLFACYCGLRISDIRSLVWGDLKMIDGSWFVVKRMKKTGDIVSVPLNMAQRYLPNKNGADDGQNIFTLPVTSANINKFVKQWAKAAGVNKNVSFHTSRHTFATLLLSVGADLYTTSKLLGHKSITTTQIYAKIVDAKKVDAIKMLEKANV
ncbi:MAG: site-specific integrase [Prevotella sp.]|nr:site-specific integrase [Prevotella sp.]